MTPPDGSEALVRGAALYLPIALAVALAGWTRPDRRRWGAVLLATVWNAVGLLVVNLLAVRAGWWRFDAGAPLVAGIPADLWVGWALVWGAVAALAPRRSGPLVGAALVAADLVLMPLGEPVVVLGPSWLAGEALAVATCLVPGLLLARWTAADERLGARVALQVLAFAGAVYLVLPALVFSWTGEGWGALLGRPRWQFVVAALVAGPFAAMAVQAVLEFARAGGTPFPLDPPKRLVRSGPYAYLANPMQAGATVLLVAWGVLLASPAIVAAAAMATVFSAGLATWSEELDLRTRFGEDWSGYRQRVRSWLPTWRPAVAPPATAYVAAGCEPCEAVGGFLGRRRPAGVALVPAQVCADPLVRITYEDEVGRASGIAAIGRTLERVHLGWAAISWIARLPVIAPALQLIADAVGAGPRDLPSPAPGSTRVPLETIEPGGPPWPAS